MTGLEPATLAKAFKLESDFGRLILCCGCVKILANPSGFAAFCALPMQKSPTNKFYDLKRVEFCVIFGAVKSVRLAPADANNPKSAKIMPF